MNSTTFIDATPSISRQQAEDWMQSILGCVYAAEDVCTIVGENGKVSFADKTLKAEKLQEFVGGCFTLVRLIGNWWMIAHDEGLLNGMKINPVGTALYSCKCGFTNRTPICGPIVLLNSAEL